MKSIDLAKELDIKHRDLVRTIKRFLSYGLNDDIKESSFTTTMNRTYKMYNLSERVVNMIESVYVYSGTKDSELKQENKLPVNELVYFISDGSRVKIGYTTNLKMRITSLQVGNPNFIEVVAIINNVSKSIEAEIHEYFAKERISGEWFNISEEQIYSLKSKYNSFQYMSTLGSAIFELWHESTDDVELELSNFTNSTNYRVKRKLKDVIIRGLDNNLSYNEIFNEAITQAEIMDKNITFK